MSLPEGHRQNLIEAHKERAQLIESDGYVPEPVETALLAEEHRWFWKPDPVRFILVAKSHVYTWRRDRSKNRPGPTA